MRGPVPPKLVWRNAFLSPVGPEKSLTRLVLSVLEMRMDPDGTRCYPGIRGIAADAGIDKETASIHVRLALGCRQDEDGNWSEEPVAPPWVVRVKRPRSGKGGEYFYLPAIPATVWARIPEEKKNCVQVYGITHGSVRIGAGTCTESKDEVSGLAVRTTSSTTPGITTPSTTGDSLLEEVERQAQPAGERLHLTGEPTDRDRVTIKKWLDSGNISAERIERGIIGLRLAIDDGALKGFIPPRDPATLGALIRGQQGNRSAWDVADEYYYKDGDQPPPHKSSSIALPFPERPSTLSAVDYEFPAPGNGR